MRKLRHARQCAHALHIVRIGEAVVDREPEILHRKVIGQLGVRREIQTIQIVVLEVIGVAHAKAQRHAPGVADRQESAEVYLWRLDVVLFPWTSDIPHVVRELKSVGKPDVELERPRLDALVAGSGDRQLAGLFAPVGIDGGAQRVLC